MTLFVIIAAFLTGLAVVVVMVPLIMGGTGKSTALLDSTVIPLS
jgi:hypothetical protein